jgi:uncharacterized protein YjiS (DUF1127 family)
MDACRPQHSSVAALFQLACWLQDMAMALRTLARRLNARIWAHRQATADRRLLDRMSEHELRDIGVSRADLWPLGDGWVVHRHDITRPAGALFPGA